MFFNRMNEAHYKKIKSLTKKQTKQPTKKTATHKTQTTTRKSVVQALLHRHVLPKRLSAANYVEMPHNIKKREVNVMFFHIHYGNTAIQKS